VRGVREKTGIGKEKKGRGREEIRAGSNKLRIRKINAKKSK